MKTIKYEYLIKYENNISEKEAEIILKKHLAAAFREIAPDKINTRQYWQLDKIPS